MIEAPEKAARYCARYYNFGRSDVGAVALRVSSCWLDEARALLAELPSERAVSQRLGVKHSTFRRMLAKHAPELAPPPPPPPAWLPDAGTRFRDVARELSTPYTPRCGSCGWEVMITDFRPYIERFGGDLQVRDFVRRLTCSRCGSRCPTGVRGSLMTAGKASL